MTPRFRTLLAAVLFCPALASAEHANDPASVVCMYTVPSHPSGTAFASVTLPDRIRGQWQHRTLAAWSNLFMTDEAHDTLRARCEQQVNGVSANGRLFAVRATGAHSRDKAAYEIWYRGNSRAGQPIERIVSFGDSLTDTGNMFLGSSQALALSPTGRTLPSAAWFAGRFSNGPTWVEYFADRNGLPLNNWAVGGAQTRNKQTVPGLSFMAIHGLRHQIDRFFEHASKLADYDPSTTLFTLLAAGNDFVNDTRNGPEIILEQEADLRRLVAGGARRILVMNLPDVTTAPIFRLRQGDAATVLGRIEYYNAHIGNVVERVAGQTGAEISLINVRANFEYMIERKEAFGFVDATESCLAIDEDSALTYLGTPPLRAGCDPKAYVFWDTLHPTTRVHELMSEWVAKGAPKHWGLR